MPSTATILWPVSVRGTCWARWTRRCIRSSRNSANTSRRYRIIIAATGAGSWRLPVMPVRTLRSPCKENRCMKFADFVSPEAIRAELAAGGKDGVIREMVQALLDAGKIEASEKESIVKAILNREEVGGTGIGRGVAVPHTKHGSVEQLVGTVGVSREGVDFDS